MFIANDDILARKAYASEKDIRPPDEFLDIKDVKASTDYGWNHRLVYFPILESKESRRCAFRRLGT